MRLILRLCAFAVCIPLAACEARSTPDEDVRRGAGLIRDKGCGLCHGIPGIRGADGLVGPPLDHVARRIYIAGRLRNSPANMEKWLRDPQAIVPGNAMPDMGISSSEARAITAYLGTLK